MSNGEMNRFRKVLEARVIELTNSTRMREAIVIQKSAEELESRLQATAREFAMRQLQSQFVGLRETRGALRRIDEGTFGVCIECDEPISLKRLAALPAAPLCIRCQEFVDCRCGAHSSPLVFAMAA